MKKNVLIVINSMELGGAQKSLVSFLKSLEESGHREDYAIDLIVAKPEGIFMDQIPSFVHMLPPVRELMWLGTPRKDPLLAAYPSLRGRLGKALWIATNKQTLTAKHLNEEQRIWKNWKRLVPKLNGHYDIAVSYMNGFPGYYVIDKVSADRKILWVHNEYEALKYDANFDRPYYDAADGIITISDVCRDSFLRVYPHLADRIRVLANITLSSDVCTKGERAEAPEFEGADGVKILSVGRLCPQKQFRLAVEAADVLAKRGMRFLWLIVGDGPDREELQRQIDTLGLGVCFRLAGAKANPYSYMARCDVFAQTSLFEGKSIVLDEVKLFARPIVVTDYPSVSDTVQDGVNGLVCPMAAERIADAIEKAAGDAALRQRFAQALAAEDGNSRELENYIRIML